MNSGTSPNDFRRALLATVLISAWPFAQPGTARAQTPPANPKPTCVVPSTLFATWIDTTASSPGNVVFKPADSETFPDVPNCTFYQWAEQMFLWLTSATPPTYGGGSGRIFDSPTFYGVSALENGARTFVPNTASGFAAVNGVRNAQVGPNGIPVILNNLHQLVEVPTPQVGPTGKPVIRDTSGRLVEFKATKMLPNGKLAFLDANGNTIPVQQGQAGGGDVLMATKNSSLVYYAIHVNDVYAYFATGVKTNAIAATHFPQNAADMAKIVTFATGKGKTFPDTVAMAVEVKTAWIDATGLDASKYVTVTAAVPVYNMLNPTQWVPTGATKQATLALVGMHVVGSTASTSGHPGHPEMIWSTFEHVNNTPNASYNYTNSGNTTTTVASSPAPAGGWLFAASSTPVNPNFSHMSVDPATGTIGALTGAPRPGTISPSDTERTNPWGTPASAGSVFTGNNTDLIAINDSIHGQLAPTDVRSNYLFTGATWTIFGAVPTQPPSSNQVGTNQMANTTMETYQAGTNCFSCHDGSNMLGKPGGGGLSHIWGPLKPLP